MAASDDFAALYEGKAEYVSRRDPSSYAARRTGIEARAFKVPNLISVVPPTLHPSVVIEIGSATGELLAEIIASRFQDARGVGFDISPSNVTAATARYPTLEFHAMDFSASDIRGDIVILSDVLEHVPDDADFLRRASGMAPLVLVNLPLEDNWLNARRNYGPDDVSGHLRKYSLQQGLDLFRVAGLRIAEWRQVWLHETRCEDERAALRLEVEGHPYGGGPIRSLVKQSVVKFSRAVQPLGRRLFSSNLFALAERADASRAA